MNEEHMMKTIYNLRYIQAEFSQNNDLVELLRPCQIPFWNLDDTLNLPFAQQIKLCFPEFAYEECHHAHILSELVLTELVDGKCEMHLMLVNMGTICVTRSFHSQCQNIIPHLYIKHNK